MVVIGKLRDTQAFIGKAECEVYPQSEDWTPEKNRAWLDGNIERGETFLAVSADLSGQYREELLYLRARHAKIVYVSEDLKND